MILKRGSKGPEVRELQLSLLALGKSPGDVDGVFGGLTEAAVIDFQDDYESMTVDGIVGPQTFGAMRQALVITDAPPSNQPAHIADESLKCSDHVWSAFRRLVLTLTAEPCVKYGPGRGLFVDPGKWVVTHGPGKLDYKSWKSKTGKTFPSFHCSSFTNFFLGWLTQANVKYTHSGNVPSLFKLCEVDGTLHKQDGVASFRGYGPYCKRFYSDGRSRARLGRQMTDSRSVDALELWERRHELPTFFVWGQSTRSGDRWKRWHHTGLFVIDHRSKGTPMYRIAADGYKSKSGAYSASPMKWKELDENWAASDLVKHAYRGYCITPPDTTVPYPEVVFEK